MYITTREMVISIICNACGVLGLILWAIEAHKSNANQRTQSVESVENNGDIIVRSNLEPFRVDEPQTEMTTEQVVNELLSIKQILDDGKMPKQTHDIRTNTHECVKDTHDKTEPQTDGYMTAEQTEDYRKMLDEAEHKVYGNIEDEPQTERSSE